MKFEPNSDNRRFCRGDAISARRSPLTRCHPLDGWLVLDKPAGITSTEAVNRIRRAFAAAKAGHAGTLDPLATGVLPIAFGAATKTVPYVMQGRKLYRFTLCFGEARDTDDADGKLTALTEARPTDAAILAALPRFTGKIMQTPPTFSAVKLGGERAYDLARAGRPAELAARPAEVDRFTLLARPDPDHAVLEVACGKGVYMRSLARDLALALGSLGHAAALRRLRVGPFVEAQAIGLDRIFGSAQNGPASPDLLLPVTTALADIPALAVTDAEAAALKQGQAISLVALMGRIPGAADPEGGLVCAMAGKRAIGLARLAEGWLRPQRLLETTRHGQNA